MRAVNRRMRAVSRVLSADTLLNGVDIGFLDGLTEARSKGNALVVHASNHGNGHALRLCRTITMIGSDVADRVAVGDNITLETPLAA